MPLPRYYTVGMVLILMAMGTVWLAALCRHAKPVVYITVAAIPLSWFSGAASAAQLGSVPSAGVFVACGLLSLLWLWCIRRKLDLTAALIQEATHVLSSHPSLVAAALGILLGLLVLFALFGTSIVLLMATGSWQLEGESGGSDGSGGSCVFVLPPASQAGLGLSAAALLWSTMLAFTLRYFTVCAPPPARSPQASMDWPQPPGFWRRALMPRAARRAAASRSASHPPSARCATRRSC